MYNVYAILEGDDDWTPITPPDGWVLLPSVPTEQNASDNPTESVSNASSSSETLTTSSPISPTESPITSSFESLSTTTTTGSFVTFTMPAESTTTPSGSPSTLSEEDTDNDTHTDRINVMNQTMVTVELVSLVNESGAIAAAATQHTTPSMVTPVMEGSTTTPLNMSDFTDGNIFFQL